MKYLRSVIAFLASEFFGVVGRLIIATAVGIQVYQITRQPLDLGWLGLVEFAPAALLVLVTGMVADRVDRRRVCAYAFAVNALASCALASFARSDSTDIWRIFLMVAVIGTGRAFAQPAQRALPVDMLPPERVPWMMARYGVTWQAAMIIGPVTAGFLYAADSALPYIVSVFCFALAAISVLFVKIEHRDPKPIPVPKDERPGGLHEALEGFRFVKSQPVLLGAISLDLFAVLFGGAVALLPAIAEDRLHVGAVGLGWLRAGVGIGASAMTLMLVFRPLKRHIGRTLLMTVAVFGLFTVVLGVTSSYVLAFISIVLLSGADAISVFIRSTLVPLITPKSKRGRVLALESVFIGASNELGAFESGIAAQLLGTASAVALGGLLTLGVAVLWAIIFPGLRDQDEFPVAEK